MSPSKLALYILGEVSRNDTRNLLTFYLQGKMPEDWDPETSNGEKTRVVRKELSERFGLWAENRERATLARRARLAEKQKGYLSTIENGVSKIYTTVGKFPEEQKAFLCKALGLRLSLNSMASSKDLSKEELKALKESLKKDEIKKAYNDALGLLRAMKMDFARKQTPLDAVQWVSEKLFSYENAQQLIAGCKKELKWESYEDLEKQIKKIPDECDTLSKVAEIHSDVHTFLSDHGIDYTEDHATPIAAIEDHQKNAYVASYFDSNDGSIKMAKLIEILEAEEILKKKEQV
jgi:hypothetical protein